VTGKEGKWTIRLSKLKPGGPYEMTIAGKNSITVKDVLVGEVWLGSGQSNMAFTVSKKVSSWAGLLNEEAEIAAANYPQIRMFTGTPVRAYAPQANIEGTWLVCSPESVPGFSAVGYLFARQLQKSLKVPVGIVTLAYGGSTAEAWIPRHTLSSDPQLKPRLDAFDTLVSFYRAHPGAMTDAAPPVPQTINARPRKPEPLRDPVQDQHQPTVLFNGLINPVIPYAIRGVIWYQGESIVGGTTGVALYAHTMEMLAKEWRRLWGQRDFPFHFVQLAALQNVSNNPIVREQQAQLLTQRNRAMAVTIDIGHRKNVHPPDKAPLGDRLARIALARTYGRSIEYSGPVYESMRIEGNSIRLKFSHLGGGLVSKGGPLKWFQLAGVDQKFVDAIATIEGDTIVVKSPEVSEPVAVRYAWANYPEGCNLYNAAGFPAAPFRTDNWDSLSQISQQFTGK
jgi:sialate O-acetylesterase